MPRCPSLTHNGFVLPNTGNRLLTLTIPYFTELHRLYPINGPRPVAVTRVVWGIWPPSNTLLLRISCLFLFKSAEFSRIPFFGDLLMSHLLSLAVALLDTTLETICLWDLASTLLTITRVCTGMAWGNAIDFTINNWKKIPWAIGYGSNLKCSEPMFFIPCETRFHTHIKQHVSLQLCLFYSLHFWVVNCLADYSVPNGSRHSPSAFCWCWFLSEHNFDMLRLFTNIWTSPHFQMTYYMCLCIVILCCMLFMEQKHIFSFLNIYFQSSLLTVDWWSLWCVCCDPVN